MKVKDLQCNTNAALVSTIETDSPASQSALKQGDLIVSMDDVGIAGAADLRNRVACIPQEQVSQCSTCETASSYQRR